jgi:site-specific DNA recombinase
LELTQKQPPSSQLFLVQPVHDDRLIDKSRMRGEISHGPDLDAESIAGRESCTTRKINMTISLAFLAPDLVKAAIDGRLPHGLGVVRLADLSAEWSRQRQMLGLPVL